MIIRFLTRWESLRALFGLMVAAGPLAATAAIMPADGSIYFQSFDSVDGSGEFGYLPDGWSSIDTPGRYNPSQSHVRSRTTPHQNGLADPFAAIHTDNGKGNSGGVISYGEPGSVDRALGTLRGHQNDKLGFGVSFQNVSGNTLSALNLSFTGEEWRLGAAGRGPDALKFQYSLNAHSLNSGHWISVPSLDFLTPNLLGVGAHDGNVAANQIFLSATLTGLEIEPGETIWLRWLDQRMPGGRAEDGLAIDNFSIAAVPETPAWIAAPGALLLLSGALWRHRKV